MARQSAEKIAELQDLVRRKREELDEDSFRYFLGEQALKLAHGGQTLMVRLSGASVSTVRKGMSEVRARFLGEEPEPARKKSPLPEGGFPDSEKLPGGLGVSFQADFRACPNLYYHQAAHDCPGHWGREACFRI